MITAETVLDSKKNSYGNLVIEVFSKDGIIIDRQEQKIDSFLENYWRKVYGAQMVQTQTLTRFDGTTANLSSSQSFVSPGGAGEEYAGVVVGSGLTAIAINDISLATLIEHGATTGRLSYGVHTQSDNYSAGTYNISRSFENNSGSSIDVNEVGLAADTTSISTNPFLIVRDILNTTVTVPDSSVLVVSYQFTTTNVNSNWRQYITGFFSYNLILKRFVGNYTSSNLYQGGWYLIGTNTNRYNPLLLSSNTEAGSITFSSPSGLHIGGIAKAEPILIPIEVDTINNTVYYGIDRYFVNSGSSNITVNSVILIASTSSSGSTHTVTSNPKAGRVLSSSKVLEPGEGLFVRWEFRYAL